LNDITINTQNNHLVSNQIIDLFSPDNLRAVLIKSLYTSFLLNSPDETLLRKYYNIADNAFEFLKNKSLNKPKIRIYTPNLTQHKFELDYTIIEILTEDLPFLTDAFPEELTENGFNIYRIFQSIIYTKRDTDGNLESLELENTPSYSKEVLLHFHISSIPNLEIFQPVEENLYKILNDIKIAVADWPTMLHHQKLYIEKSLPTLSQEIKNDIEDFINWNSKNFIFLGYAHLNLTKEGFEQFEKLGILSFKYNDYLIKELNEDIFTNELTGIEHFIQVGRFSTKSSINAHKNLSYFCFKEY
jgi:glutamate dehydrogenase